MSRSRSKKSKGAQLPLFIQKLIQMLQDQSINSIISWTSTNDSFNIKSITQFTQTILPKYFKHNNFSSFIRQLNMYGFRKIRHEDGQNVYQNQNFKRGNRSLLKNIKRKINQQKDDKLAVYTQEGSPGNYTLARQVQEMKNKQKDLEQICRHLLMQNQKLIQENNTLVKKMKQQSRRKQKKLEQLLLTYMASNQNNQVSLTNGQNGTANSNANMGNMLSIMAGDNSDSLNMLNQKNDQTPLDVLTNALSRNKNMRQFKQMLQNYYNSDTQPNGINGRRITRNNNKNQSHHQNQNYEPDYLRSPRINHNHIVPNHHDQDSNFNFSNNEYNDPINFFDQSNQNQPSNNIKPSLDQDGFISINDFMNLEDDQNDNPILSPNNNEEEEINLEESH